MNKRRLYFCLFVVLMCIGVAYFSMSDKSESAITMKSERAQLKAEKKKCDCCKKLSDFRKRYEARKKAARENAKTD